jgi:hypothetical protein
VNDEADDEYDEEVHDAAKFALSIQREDYTTNLELIISCQNLPRMDLFSHSDPMVVVRIEQENANPHQLKAGNEMSRYKELGRTEVLLDNPNPKFSRVVTAPYNFEKK